MIICEQSAHLNNLYKIKSWQKTKKIKETTKKLKIILLARIFIFHAHRQQKKREGFEKGMNGNKFCFVAAVFMYILNPPKNKLANKKISVALKKTIFTFPQETTFLYTLGVFFLATKYVVVWSYQKGDLQQTPSKTITLLLKHRK